MATTFLALTNRLLRRINEVEIESSAFAAVRGVQALAKDAINASINDINSEEFEWPFNAALYTQLLTSGTEEYNFPTTLKIPKWDSFHLVKNDALGTNGQPLLFISRDVRNRYLKNDDDNAGVAGRNAPTFVFEKQGFGFGISPSPDEAYTVTYEYFIQPVQLSAYTDTSAIPEYYDEAIIQGGLYHMYMFRDNNEQADRASSKFKNEISRMRTILINKEDRIRGTLVERKRSVGASSNDYFRF